MKFSLAEELRRKLAHFFGLAWVLVSYYVTLKQTILILGIFFFFALINASLHKYLIRIPLLGNFVDFLHSMSRAEERQAKIYYGAVYFFGSLIVILYATQSLPIFRGAAIVLIIGDAFSAIIGKAFGKTELPYNPFKSVEGTIAGFIAASIAASFVLPIPLAIFAALIGMFVESIPWDLNDNLTIPLGVGFFLWIITAL